MWANRDWAGRYFPSATRPGAELGAYATWCDAVEANTVFHALPTRETTSRWAELTPDTFRFVCKLPRTISHDRRLRDTEAVAGFFDAVEPLGERLGLSWVQLPASFGPDELPTLGRFLGRFAQRSSWAVEVRHPAFAAGATHERALDDLLREFGADRVLFDTRALFSGPCSTPQEVEAFERKPRLAVRPVALGRHPVVRFLGRTDEAENPHWWSPWVPKLAQWITEGREPYWFMHTPDNTTSIAQARQVHAAVAAEVEGLRSLPEPAADPDQLRLL